MNPPRLFTIDREQPLTVSDTTTPTAKEQELHLIRELESPIKTLEQLINPIHLLLLGNIKTPHYHMNSATIIGEIRFINLITP